MFDPLSLLYDDCETEILTWDIVMPVEMSVAKAFPDKNNEEEKDGHPMLIDVCPNCKSKRILIRRYYNGSWSFMCKDCDREVRVATDNFDLAWDLWNNTDDYRISR